MTRTRVSGLSAPSRMVGCATRAVRLFERLAGLLVSRIEQVRAPMRALWTLHGNALRLICRWEAGRTQSAIHPFLVGLCYAVGAN